MPRDWPTTGGLQRPRGPTILPASHSTDPRPDRSDPLMATDKPIRVAIIGLGFGAEFIPIYQAYPGAEISAICRRSKKDLDECGDRWKIAKRFTDFRDV